MRCWNCGSEQDFNVTKDDWCNNCFAMLKLEDYFLCFGNCNQYHHISKITFVNLIVGGTDDNEEHVFSYEESKVALCDEAIDWWIKEEKRDLDIIEQNIKRLELAKSKKFITNVDNIVEEIR